MTSFRGERRMKAGIKTSELWWPKGKEREK